MTEQKKKLEKLSGVKGMNDILPQDAALWEFFESTVKSMLRAYGYQQIRTPIVEPTQLFTRGIGEVTDIVEKEMYSFTDALNGEQLTHASRRIRRLWCVLSIEHNLLYDGPKRLVVHRSRCSVTNVRSAGAIGNFIKSAWKRSASPDRTLTLKSS